VRTNNTGFCDCEDMVSPVVKREPHSAAAQVAEG
jgi:hypothetical protein